MAQFEAENALHIRDLMQARDAWWKKIPPLILENDRSPLLAKLKEEHDEVFEMLVHLRESHTAIREAIELAWVLWPEIGKGSDLVPLYQETLAEIEGHSDHLIRTYFAYIGALAGKEIAFG